MADETFPLRMGMRQQKVAELQSVLEALLAAGLLAGHRDGGDRETRASFARERKRRVFGETTRNLVSSFQAQHGLKETGEVDQRTARAMHALLPDGREDAESPGARGTYAVRGVVQFDVGLPASGLPVTAYDRDLRAEQLLGRAETDARGGYRIEYSERDFLTLERGSADLVVRVSGANGAPLVSSDVYFNAPREAEIDVSIPPDRSTPPALFDRLAAIVAPLLGELTIDQLDESDEQRDLTFLAGETGCDVATLARFVLAHQLARPGIEPEFWFGVLGRSAFAYTDASTLEQNLGEISSGLASLDDVGVGKALDGAFARGDITDALREKVATWIAQFDALMARGSLDDAGTPSFAKLALEHAGIDNAKKQQRFALLLREQGWLTPEMLAALASDRSFKKGEIADLTASYRLADLTGSDFSVVGMLKDTFEIRRPDQVWSLAKLSRQQWIDMISARVQDGSIKVPLKLADAGVPVQPPQTEVYATTLERQFREAFPTGAFAGGLERALGNGGTRGIEHADALAQFLNRHTDFELLCTSVDDYLDTRVRSDARRLARNEAFRTELKAVQRVFKLAPTFTATDALLGEGLHSAQLIYRSGESSFVTRYTGLTGAAPPEASLVWKRAAETHAAVLTVVGDLQALRAEQLPMTLQNNNAALATFPNWDNLFHAGDLCACEECRSVLGPAAYFADLLMFLKDRKAVNPALTVKDVLFERRADLGYLELTCANANTELPYIDLVCEVLESVVAAGDGDLELVGLVAIPAAPAAARTAVSTALTAVNIEPGPDYQLSQVDPADPDRWVVHGESITLLLKKKATANFFVQVVPNTKADSDELRAYPAYVDKAAYAKLREARFPFALPFDLFADEVRAAFHACNLQRWDLMRAVHGAALPNNATEGEIAAEFFGIASNAAAPIDEKRLILLADPSPAGQQAIWGRPETPAGLPPSPTSRRS